MSIRQLSYIKKANVTRVFFSEDKISNSLNKIIADKNVHAQHILPLELMDKTNSTYYVFCRKCVNLSSSCRKLFGIDQKGGNAISYTINDICNKCLYMLQAL